MKCDAHFGIILCALLNETSKQINYNKNVDNELKKIKDSPVNCQ